MTKIAVFSDTHGSLAALDTFLPRLGMVDAVYHLGDCIDDSDAIAMRLCCGCVTVRGNCDPWSSTPLERVIPICGKRILLLHGHLVGGRQSLLYLAQSRNADAVLFGHSHVASLEQADGVLLLNPGSLSRPRSMDGASCALLTVTEADLHAELLFARTK